MTEPRLYDFVCQREMFSVGPSPPINQDAPVGVNWSAALFKFAYEPEFQLKMCGGYGIRSALGVDFACTVNIEMFTGRKTVDCPERQASNDLLRGCLTTYAAEQKRTLPVYNSADVYDRIDMENRERVDWETAFLHCQLMQNAEHTPQFTDRIEKLIYYQNSTTTTKRTMNSSTGKMDAQPKLCHHRWITVSGIKHQPPLVHPHGVNVYHFGKRGLKTDVDVPRLEAHMIRMLSFYNISIPFHPPKQQKSPASVCPTSSYVPEPEQLFLMTIPVVTLGGPETQTQTPAPPETVCGDRKRRKTTTEVPVASERALGFVPISN